MAVEWKDVLIESIKGAIVLAMERLYVTRAGSWFEDHIGEFVCRALLRPMLHEPHPAADRRGTQTTTAFRASCSATHKTMNVFQQSRLLWKHTKRISSG